MLRSINFMIFIVFEKFAVLTFYPVAAQTNQGYHQIEHQKLLGALALRSGELCEALSRHHKVDLDVNLVGRIVDTGRNNRI